MNQTSNSERVPPSFIPTYINSQCDNTLTVSTQSNLQDMLSIRAVHDTSASNTQIVQYQPPQQIFQPSITNTQTSYGNSILPVHPTAFFYRPSNDFRHYYISCKEIEVSYDTIGCLLNKTLKGHNNNKKECIFYHQQQCNNRL